jgi:hypothetical protein
MNVTFSCRIVGCHRGGYVKISVFWYFTGLHGLTVQTIEVFLNYSAITHLLEAASMIGLNLAVLSSSAIRPHKLAT